MERTSANLSMRFAILGSNSEIRMPGTLVEIGLKLLLALGSHVSIWLGPPSSQNRITAFALPFAVDFASAAAASTSRKEMPRNPSEPAVTKLLRVVGCCIAILSMIFRKFAGANQGPDKFPQSGLPVSTLRQNGFQRRHFIRRGRAAERRKIELSENLLICRPGFEQFREPAVRPAETVHVSLACEHVQGLAEVGLIAAFRDRAAIGAAVNLQKP